jgi:hypothetical protein
VGVDFFRIGSRSRFHDPYNVSSVLSHYDVDFCADDGVMSGHDAEELARALEDAPEPTLDQTRSRLVAAQRPYSDLAEDDVWLKEFIREIRKERRKFIRFLRRDCGPIFCDM